MSTPAKRESVAVEKLVSDDVDHEVKGFRARASLDPPFIEIEYIHVKPSDVNRKDPSR